jgi:hypothetical protein
MNNQIKSVKYRPIKFQQSIFEDIMRYGQCALIFLTLITAEVSAGELILKNGDLIRGNLVELTSEQLVWASENFGQLTVATDKIDTVNGLTASASLNAMGSPVFSSTYGGTLSATGAYASGNEEREDWDIEGSVQWRQGDFRHRSAVNYESHRLDNIPAKEEYRLDYGLDWFFGEQWFWSNSLIWGANDNRGIEQYYAAGSAIGRQFWDSEKTALSAESGLLWIREEYQNGTEDGRLTWSWAADYRRMLTSSLELFHSHSLRASINDLDDSELRADLGLKAPLIKDVFTELKFEWIYDNQPIEGTESSDSQLTIGVSYSW